MSEQREKSAGVGVVDRALRSLTYLFTGEGKATPFEFSGSPAYGQYGNQGILGLVGPINPVGTYGTTLDYTVQAGDLIDNSAVMACMNWIMRNFTKSPIRVMRETEAGPEEDKAHALTKLLTKPNPNYSGKMLWKPTLLSLNWNGNAYWRKVRNSFDQVIELWYEPHWNMRPVRANPDDFISYYEIWRNRQWQRIEVRDVVHLRYGLDPRNTMMGLSPLGSALREVFTDNEAARYAAILFKKMGVIGGLITPKSLDDEIDDPDALVQTITQLTTGDNRGAYVAYSVPLELIQPKADTANMNTRENRKLPEERISGLLGIPASVAGLGAGLDHNIYNNSKDAKLSAYEDNIIPTQDSLTEELDVQLLPEFGDPTVESVSFDNSKIRVLQGDQDKKDQTTTAMWNSNVIKRNEARLRIGLTVDPTDDVYKYQVVPASGPPAGAPPPQPPVAPQPGPAAPKGLLYPERKATTQADRDKLQGEIAGDVEPLLAGAYKKAANGVA